MARKVVLYGQIVDDAFAKARELALEKGYVFIHAFDDPQIIAGAGTRRRSRCSRTRPTSTRSWCRSAAAGSCPESSIAARA